MPTGPHETDTGTGRAGPLGPVTRPPTKPAREVWRAVPGKPWLEEDAEGNLRTIVDPVEQYPQILKE